MAAPKKKRITVYGRESGGDDVEIEDLRAFDAYRFALHGERREASVQPRSSRSVRMGPSR